ncbi:MAG TPA: FG-GAP-like repeat-containing protein [Candidatus Brocadiia bacterium]|nr:FG-GAP-like repeat-containing protein [Candidatus Brocadiia bacterium]
MRRMKTDRGNCCKGFSISGGLKGIEPLESRLLLDAPTGVIDTPANEDIFVPGESVFLSASGSDPDGTIQSWHWEVVGYEGFYWTSDVEDPGKLVLPDKGQYDITLTVTDNDGNPDPNPPTVSIGAFPLNGFIYEEQVDAQSYGYTVLVCWGDPLERGFAQGYYKAEEIEETFYELLAIALTYEGVTYEVIRSVPAQVDWGTSDLGMELQGLYYGLKAAKPDTALDLIDIQAMNLVGDVLGLACRSHSCWGDFVDGTTKTLSTRRLDYPDFSNSQYRHLITASFPESGCSRINVTFPGCATVATGLNQYGTQVSVHNYYPEITYPEIGSLPRSIASHMLLTSPNDGDYTHHLADGYTSLQPYEATVPSFINYFAPDGSGGVITCDQITGYSDVRVPQPSYFNGDVLITTNEYTDGTYTPYGGEFLADYYAAGGIKTLQSHWDVTGQSWQRFSVAYRGENDMTMWFDGQLQTGYTPKVVLEYSDLQAEVDDEFNDSPNGKIDSPLDGAVIPDGQAINLQASGYDTNGTVTGWDWQITGPNGYTWSSTAEDPGSLTLPEAGEYTVTLTVTDDGGLDDPIPDAITIIMSDGSPRVTTMTPAPGATVDDAQPVITLAFDQSLNPLTVTTDTVKLLSPGADGIPLTADDSYFGVTDLVYSDILKEISFRPTSILPNDEYYVLLSAGVGNVIGQWQAITTCDDLYDIYWNGTSLGSASDWMTAETWNLNVLSGPNVLAVHARDTGGSAGFLASIDGGVSVSDTTWLVSESLVSGWAQPGFDDSGWVSATSWGQYPATDPWRNHAGGFPNPTDALWIWSDDNYFDDEVWFRKEISSPLVQGVAGADGKLVDGEFSGSLPSGNGYQGGYFLASFTVHDPGPTVLSVTPSGIVGTAVDEIVVEFSEALDAVSAEDVGNYAIFASGGDGFFGDETDRILSGIVQDAAYSDGGGAGPFVVTISLNPALTDEAYEFVIDGNASVKDVFGNPLNDGADERRGFTVDAASPAAVADLLPASDLGASDSDNLTAANKPGYAVTVNEPGMLSFDFDGDGVTDGRVAVGVAGTVQITAGFQTGTFQPSVSQSLGSNAQRIAPGDFNGDGFTDLAISDKGADRALVFLGDGAGAFALSQTLAMGNEPHGIAVTDMDCDGDLDLAVGDQNGLAVFFNESGTFVKDSDYACGSLPAHISVADMDSDGDTDIVTANFPGNNASILFNDGDGSFSRIDQYSGLTSASGLAVADFNADDVPDFAVATFFAATFTVFLNDGSGNCVSSGSYTIGPAPWYLATGDLNGDAINDIVSANSEATYVSVLMGNGDGTFAPRIDYATGSEPLGVGIRDLNADGWADLAVANRGSGNVSILLNDGTGVFVKDADYATGAGAHDVAVKDYNGDGALDIACVNEGAKTLSIMMGALSPLPDGVHPINITFTDSAGNVATDSDPTTIDTVGPVVNKWQIAATHGGGIGELVNDIASGYVESRYQGIRKLVINMDDAMSPGSVSVSDLSIVGVSHGNQSSLITSATVAGNKITIGLSAALPDIDTYTVTLGSAIEDLAGNGASGLSQITVKTLRGDANGDGQVNSFDLLNIRAFVGQAVNAANARRDINGDGVINSFDQLMARVYVGNKIT